MLNASAEAAVDAVTGAATLDEELPAVMSKAEYGRYRRAQFGAGSPPAVTKWIRESKITAPALRPDGRIDRAAADGQLAARLDASRMALRPIDVPEASDEDDEDPAPTLPARNTYSEAQIALARARQRKVELDIAEREGVLVEKAEVEQAQFDTARRLRDRLLSIPQRLGPKLVAGVDDERTAAALVRDAIMEVLNEAADDLDPDSDDDC